MRGKVSACEYVLRILMNMEDLKVKTVKTQYSIRQVGTHSVYLDVLAEDSKGRIYEMEIQNGDSDSHVRRVRYITGSIDTATLDKGMSYQNMPELHIFYITTFDLAGLMKYFVKTEGSDTSRGALSRRVGYLKNEGNGEEYMCDVIMEFMKEHMSDLMEEVKRKSIEEGKVLGKASGEAQGRANALALAKMYYQGKTAVEISITLNMPEEDVADAIRQLEED